MAMETRTDEIADGIYRFSTLIDKAAPGGFQFNQFLIHAEEPLLFHTGLRSLFPLVTEAVGRIRPVEDLRWITFGHVEADECGSMNEWLEAAPRAEVAHGGLGCAVSLNDLCLRPPRPLADGEVLDLGGKRVRHLDTPHVPHGWEARVLYEETTGTLLCGDLLTQTGDGKAVSEDDPIERAIAAEDLFRQTAPTTLFAPTVRRLAGLEPTTLATMHGTSYRGDGAAALRTLADEFESRYLAVPAVA
jgi:flavorubredoxin